MPVSSVEDLKRRIAAGEYAIDSGTLADTIVTKIGIVRRVSRFLESEDEEAAGKAGSRAPSRARGGTRSAQRPLQRRR
jgi:hypothetical protein